MIMAQMIIMILLLLIIDTTTIENDNLLNTNVNKNAFVAIQHHPGLIYSWNKISPAKPIRSPTDNHYVIIDMEHKTWIYFHSDDI